ncbi:MAG: di-heme oxidoredictase family protein [Candidatus Polarisedimenticolia bacterium]
MRLMTHGGRPGFGPRAAHAAALMTLTLLPLAGCAREPEPGDPLPGLTEEQLKLFERGRAVFARTFEPATGLGPLFNAPSCGECHEQPVLGGSGDEVELHATVLQPDGTCDLLLAEGGPVFQNQVTPALREALGIEEEPVPERAARARRTTPDVLGFGLLDAVPESVILALADPEDRDGDGISGRPNRFIDGRLGRFGRKAFLPTLREFNDGAFPIEQGITTPVAPAEGTVGGRPLPPGVDAAPDPEIDREALDLTDAFVRFLAPPAALRGSLPWRRGERQFGALGCAACHVPVLKTGDHPVKAIRHRKVRAWTDLLLHDMGPELADICLGLAAPSEFRTEPLMGLRLSSSFLHDGRAASVEEAVRLHGGEAAASRDRFLKLSASDRRVLLRFLESL